MKSMTRVAMVAGEPSGDILGAGLIKALRVHYPECVFEGIGGPRMIAQGFVSHSPLERLAVMGLVEPLKRLPELLAIRRNLRQRFIADPPDIFIGIDAPDFNLSLELALKKHKIKTAHYVSPSVWAWRQGRVKKIARAVDLMLTLFPFEAAFYQKHAVKVCFVGHPLADQIELQDTKLEARHTLGLDPEVNYLAILPGSRKSEVEKLTPVFLQAASLCRERDPSMKFLIPAANQLRYSEIKQHLENHPELNVRLINGNSQGVMASADAVLIASGTSTLEAMLLKRPMVIAYRVAGLTYWILKHLVKSKYIGLPNLLANKSLVPEFIQSDVTAEKLSSAVMKYLDSTLEAQALMKEYLTIHKSLRKNASEQAARALIGLWETQ